MGTTLKMFWWKQTFLFAGLALLLAAFVHAQDEDRSKRGNYVFDWPAIIKYVKKSSNRVVLYNVMEDPEEKNDLAAEHPELVQVMSGRLMDLYSNVGDIIIYHSEPKGNPDNYDGVWSPG